MDRAVLETASDRYVIIEYLAEGGMGAIYLGKKLGVDGFEKEVVLKQLLPEFTREPKFIELFLREARLSASLEHANIVRTIDLVHAGDDYFMVMEYVRGADLRTLMRRARRRRRQFSPGCVVFIGHELIEALSYAHTKAAPDGRPLGLIHRDISPSNILLSAAGEVKLTDFGIAKASTHRSIFYKVKGKVGYMSPEQARGESVDARSDLFSLAVVLYEVLVGERLFVGDLLSAAAMVYSQPVTPPSRKRRDVPPELDSVILKALALEPKNRYQDAEEFQETLTRVAYRLGLMPSAAEVASQLRDVAGEDVASWLRVESFATEQGGTAVVNNINLDDDDDEPAEPSRSQKTGWLEGGTHLSGMSRLFREDSGLLVEEPRLEPLEPHGPSVPIDVDDGGALGSAGTMTRPDFASDDGEDTQNPTIVREPVHIAAGSSPTGARPRSEDETTLRPPNRPARDPTRESQRSSTPMRESQRSSTPMRESQRSSTPMRESAQRVAAPLRESAPRVTVDPTLRDPNQRASVDPTERDPRASDPTIRESSPRMNDLTLRDSAFSRDVPTRESKTRPRPLLALLALLVIVGVAVALAVAFSGPELEVGDSPGEGATSRPIR